MKGKRIFLSVIILIIPLTWALAQQKEADFPVLTGPYLGQKPPGKIAASFAPGIINTADHDYHSDFYFDDKFFIFKRSTSYGGSTVLVTLIKNGRWIKPSPTPFPGKPWYHNYPYAKEGRIIYFAWRGSLGNITSSSDLNLWMVKKEAKGWSSPVKLKSPINTSSYDTWPSVTRNRTIYFFSGREDGFGRSDIYRSRLGNGEHRDAENLGKTINTQYTDNDPFIAQDESYLIFCSNRPGGKGKLDMYISFRHKGDQWTNPVNMGDAVNGPDHEERPYVTPDGKFLFFTSRTKGKLDIFWISAELIKELRPKE